MRRPRQSVRELMRPSLWGQEGNACMPALPTRAESAPSHTPEETDRDRGVPSVVEGGQGPCRRSRGAAWRATTRTVVGESARAVRRRMRELSDACVACA